MSRFVPGGCASLAECPCTHLDPVSRCGPPQQIPGQMACDRAQLASLRFRPFLTCPAHARSSRRTRFGLPWIRPFSSPSTSLLRPSAIARCQGGACGAAARRQRRALPLSGPPGARRTTRWPHRSRLAHSLRVRVRPVAAFLALPLSRSRPLPLGRPAGVAPRWLRQPGPSAHSHGISRPQGRTEETRTRYFFPGR